MNNILHVQEGDWQAIEARTQPALVDFWASWCGPCVVLTPTFERLAAQYGNEITFAKVNVDELPALADRFGVRSIPTLLLFRNGEVVERLVGVWPYEELARVPDRYIAVAVKK